MPPATMLFVMVRVTPPKGKQKTVKINYIISPNNVTFTDEPEHKKRILVDCMAIAFDNNGKEVAHASDTLDGTIPITAYEAIMQQGVLANQEIELKPGTYNLRLVSWIALRSRSVPWTSAGDHGEDSSKIESILLPDSNLLFCLTSCETRSVFDATWL